MERVLGIGGFFFAAQNPEKLQAWYRDVLGVQPPPESYNESSWRQNSGATVFAAMVAAADHLRGRPFALNFRVKDLDATARQLRAAGVEVVLDTETYPNGRFADLVDPEGNPIQLWQASGADAD